MAETKSVHFSPILEQPSDETINITSDIGLFPEGINFEDTHVTSQSKSAKKYRLPGDHDGEYRAPPRRKIALLVLGFVLLLCIGGVAIYLITRELYNRQEYAYSGNVGKKNAGFSRENTTLQVHTSRLLTPTVINVSSGKCFFTLFVLSCVWTFFKNKNKKMSNPLPNVVRRTIMQQ